MIIRRLPLLLTCLLFWFHFASFAAADTASLFSRALVEGKLAATETFVAKYHPDLNVPLPLEQELQLRPLSIVLTQLNYAQRSRLPGQQPLAKESEMLALLLKLGADPVYQEPALAGKTPLHMIFDLPQAEQAPLLQQLLQSHAAPNLSLPNHQGQTPVEYAQSLNPELARWLKDYHPPKLSDFEIRNSAFALAAGERQLQQLATAEALCQAVKHQDLNAAERLLQTQSADAYTLSGTPLLHQLVLEERLNWLTLWQRQQADLNLPNLQGQQAIHLAAQAGKTNALTWLLQQGVSPNRRDVGQKTPLHWAVLGNQVQTVQLLLTVGASASLADQTGQSPKALAEQQFKTSPATYWEIWQVLQKS